MNRLLRAGLWLLLSFLLGFGSGLVFKLYYESQTFKPYSWDTSPIVLNCYGGDFSELQLVRAIDYWAIREQNIAFYEMNPSDDICQKDWITGFIILKKAGRSQFNDDTLASTRRYTSGIKMKGAVIYFTAGAQNLTLLIEHELGHAFGYAHVEKEGHVMHPIWELMGPEFSEP